MKKDAPTKSKFRTLKRRLGKPHYAVVGVLESLWLATQIDAIDGAIGKLSNEEIAAAIEWDGDADLLIQTLVDTGWLDADPEFRLVVHDWSEHVPTFVKGAFEKHKKLFADQVAKQRPRQGAKHEKNGGKSGAKQGASEGALARPILFYSIQTNSDQSLKAADAAELPPSLQDEKFVLAWIDWLQHRKEIGKPLKPTGIKNLIAKLTDMGPTRGIAAIRYSIANSYQGLFEENQNGKRIASRVGPGQQYDPADESERTL